ncbi:AraC family ligand binding domain-containing protein [Paenibacillus tarimensis]
MKEHYTFSIALNGSPGTGELAVLFCGEGSPFPLHKMGPAIHDYFLIHTVSKGQGVFETGGKRYNCRTGDTFFILPGELFSYEADAEDPWTYHWIAFRGHGAASIVKGLGVSSKHPVVHMNHLRRILHLYRRMTRLLQSSNRAVVSDLEASGWLRLMLAEFASHITHEQAYKFVKASDTDRQMDQAVRWLSLQYEKPISIDQMAKSLGYHRTHLSKLFRQTTGMSPMQYLYKVRMERAEELLAGPLTINQVASSVGYSDALYFSKQFRKWKGVSPTEFRNRMTATILN